MNPIGRLTRGAAAIGLASAFALPMHAQEYFGQNQVQYDRLRWRVIETEHFLVHYYPEVGEVAPDAARMAERSYARLSKLMAHQFREKKPILIFGSSGDFAQSNVFGDLGEGTGGVTDPLRQRMAQFFSGDWNSFEHVLQHEMVHVFQFDIFSRGRAGSGLQNLAQVNPPLWFMEGLAEYFSIGEKHPWTDAWVRDGVVNGTLPSIRQMMERPDKYFPYRYGLSVWQFVGAKWGDEVIGEIMNAVPSLGLDRAFRREIGLTLDDLSEEWKQAMQTKYLPVIAELDRPRSFAEPLLSQRRSGSIANLFVAPAMSPDGKLITYIAYGSLLRGEVFPDLYLANAETGKRIDRLIRSSTNPDFEQLRFIYSQPSFSPDGKLIAFTSQRGGRDVLNVLEVKSRKVIQRFDPQLDQILSPTFSPDGRRIVFSGLRQGSSDLYMVSRDTPGATQLTKDQYGDLQPQWSPDGRTIAFASDRGDETDFSVLKVGKLKMCLLDIETQKVTVVPNQGGLNINPQWAPDGKSIAYVSDRTGVANLFLYEFDSKEHFQLTNVAGAVTAVSEYSPAISWAREADVLAFVYYEKSDHAIWKMSDPRKLKKLPFRTTTVVAQTGGGTGTAGQSTTGTTGTNIATGQTGGGATAPTAPVTIDPTAHLPIGSVRDSAASRLSIYRPLNNVPRVSSELPATSISKLTETVSVRAMMDSFDFNLPDSTRFRDGRYKVRFTPEYVSQPSIGYQGGGLGQQGTYGGTTIVLSDLMGDHRLALSGALNGQLSDAQLFVGYTNLGNRLQYSTGVSTQPYLLYSGGFAQPLGGTQFAEQQQYMRLVMRDVFFTSLYPLNRFTRFELGARFTNIDQQVFTISRVVDYAFGYSSGFERSPTSNLASANNIAPFLGWVTDNTLNGYTGPISGKRIRMQVEPSIGDWTLTNYLVDGRSYTPILFNYITFATRLYGSMAVGRDEARFPKWIARPDFVRGFNREDLSTLSCTGLPTDNGSGCNGADVIGSRIAFANAELRFPIVRRVNSGFTLPPLDGLFFYDTGVAWSAGQSIHVTKPAGYNPNNQRALLQSYGAGMRLNLFNIAIVRYDWAIPINRPGSKAFGTWFFGASY